MSIIIDKQRTRDLAEIWANRSTGLYRISRGLAYRVVILFTNWLNRYGIWLMTHFDNVGQTESFEEMEDRLREIQKWKKEKK